MPILDYSPQDAALLVAMHRLLELMERVPRDEEGFSVVRRGTRLAREADLVAQLLHDRGWATYRETETARVLRITPSGDRELQVFLRRTREAAARARGEVVEEWVP